MCVFHACVHTCACMCMYACVSVSLCVRMCVAVSLCMYVHCLWLWAFICTVCVHVYVCWYMHVCSVYVCVRVHACVCFFVYMYVHLCALCMCVLMVHACVLCVHVYCVCACMCVHVYALFLGVFMCAMHVYMCACIYVHHWRVHLCALCVCVGTCMCAVCTHLHTHIHVCAHMLRACACTHPAGVSPPTHSLFSPQSAVECSSLLRTLHGLEQEHLRRSLALQQEEDLAKAHRQLAIFQRNELHNIFFTQIKSAIFKGELKPEAAKMLLQDYSKIQVMPPMRLPLMEESFSWTVSLNVSSPRVKSCLFFCAGFQWTNLIFLPPLDVEGDFPVSRENKWWLEAQALDSGSPGPEF